MSELENARARRIVDKKLSDDWSVLLTVSRMRSTPELDLPNELLQRQNAVLVRIGRKINPPMPDLHVNGNGVRCTLTFPAGRQKCFIPWDCVVAISASNGFVIWKRGLTLNNFVPANARSAEVIDLAEWKASRAK